MEVLKAKLEKPIIVGVKVAPQVLIENIRKDLKNFDDRAKTVDRETTFIVSDKMTIKTIPTFEK
ncbi:MAG: hypothetical protein ACUVQ0_01570 [Thermoproteota archaeon]